MNIDPRCSQHPDGSVCCGGTCKPVTKLEDLVITEVSLVESPANFHSKVVILKSDNDEHAPEHEGDTITKEENQVEHTISEILKIDKALAGEYGGVNHEIRKSAKVDKQAAEELLDKMSVALRAKDPAMSAESAFCKAMDVAPNLAGIAVGGEFA